ncbi:hypothetical protein M422DRAFT_250572 [Sphaerobolus stellatus SS14]|uniref:Uncharacterized protein n=1 Tax=Sphaerobolus stellatus (strain SS14) TaxID=990650 RepID=A0A0C9W2D6_SPHS4|nr:hypothetical protein M422DRAFT_250572 [Sphaerobolus stellatus SS14]
MTPFPPRVRDSNFNEKHAQVGNRLGVSMNPVVDDESDLSPTINVQFRVTQPPRCRFSFVYRWYVSSTFAMVYVRVIFG